MNTRLFLKSLSIFGVLLFVAYFQTALANPEECDEDGNLLGTDCPCYLDEGEISICGNIGRSGIEKVTSYKQKQLTRKDVYTTLRPIENVNIQIYENNPEYPGTVGPFGDFDSQYGYCTTNSQGNYGCKVRQIVPGYNVWIVASCSGTIKWIKNIPTFQSLRNLDMDIDCGDNVASQPLPSHITFAERNKFLGCTFDEGDLNVGFGDGQDELITQQTERTGNTNVGIIDYDKRYIPFDGLSLFPPPGNIDIGAFGGAFLQDDCLWQYGDGPDDPDAVIECDINGAMSTKDRATRSFLKSIPKELTEKAYRRFENRIAQQREVADAANPARATHLMFGDCVGGITKRYFQQADNSVPIACEELRKCKDTVSDPYRNVQTTYSIFARIASPISVINQFLNPEVPLDQVICRTDEGEDVTLAQIQPAQAVYRTSSCEPGSAGCIYKLSSDYLLPQLLQGSGTKPHSYQTVDDAYWANGMKLEDPWELNDNEAEQAHFSGTKVIYDEGPHHNNSPLTMTRIVTNTLGNSNEVIGHAIFSPIDAADPTFEPPTDTTIWDVGSDIQSLCTLSGSDVNIENGVTLPEETADLAVNNNFIGGHELHDSHPGAGTSTYGTQIAIDRDAWLVEDASFDTDDSLFRNMVARDLFDTAMTVSEGGTVQDFSLIGAFFDLFNTLATRLNKNNVYKSFTEHVDSWSLNLPNEEMTVTHCIAQPEAEQIFPVFLGLNVPNGYPGDGGACYPWIDIHQNELCNVAPGPGNDPVGALRTCKVTKCQVWTKESKCKEYNTDVPPKCIKWKIDEDKVLCDNDPAKVAECLRNQEDTWGIAPPDPDDGETEEILNCDLERAGPMRIASALQRTQSTLITQEPLPNDMFQADSRGVPTVTDHLALSFTSPIDPMAHMPAMSFIDCQTSNNLDGEGIASRFCAGIPAQALGTGATTSILKLVSFPTGTVVKLADYLPFVQTCSDANCPTIPPPPPIELDDLPDGGSCTPNTQKASCPLILSEEMEKVIGAAGAHSGAPGALILAAMLPEGAFGPSSFKSGTSRWVDNWIWSAENVEAWSVNWNDMMPVCDPMVWTASGPFGHLGNSYGGAFKIAVDQGGYEPSRFVPGFGPVVQKCNLIDAAYAAAKKLSYPNPSCDGWTRDQVIDVLTVYRGGTPPPPEQMEVYDGCK